MVAMDELNPYVIEFAENLRMVMDVPEPPSLGSPSQYYSHWFSAVNFLSQTHEDPQRPVPEWLLNRASSLGEALHQQLDIPITPIPSRLTVSGLGFWILTLAAATSGDNWCYWPSHASKSPMEIVRYADPELEMECRAGHRTRYEIDQANDYIRKRP